MKKSERRPRRGRDEWRVLVGEWKASGAPAGEFARVRGLSLHSLLYWSRMLARESAARSTPKLLPVTRLIVGFQHQDQAERYLAALRERFEGFGLALHADKTRLIEFGRFAALSRAKRGDGKPETFNFLGFTHFCARTRSGWFAVGRSTMRKRWQGKLREVYAELRRRMHDPVPVQGAYVQAVVRGHTNYFGVPGNARSVTAFRSAVTRIWRRTLSRRSQKGQVPWRRMVHLVTRWVPPARLRYKNPDGHLHVITQGKSPVR